MKTNIKYNDSCECFFDVEIHSKEVENVLNEVYVEIRKHAKVPGFRPGMAPQDLLEKYHGDYAREEALKKLVSQGCRNVLDEKNIDAVSIPEVSEVIFEKGKNLTFKAKVDVRPNIKLKEYKGIKVKSQRVEVTDPEVDEALSRFQNMHAQYIKVEEKRPVKKGDFAICDIEALIDGKPISKKHKNMWVEVDKKSSILGVGEDLIGMNIGDVRELDIVLPQDYPDKKYAGQKAKFVVSVNEIRDKKMPNIDDDFAKEIGASGVAELKENVKKQLFDKKENDRQTDIKNQIIKKLLDDYKVNVPKSMVKRQFEILQKHFQEELAYRGVPKDAVAGKVKEFDKEIMEDAKNKVAIYFILEKIAEKENIEINEEMVNAKLENIALSTKQDVDTVRNYYENNGIMDGFLVQIREEKTLEWLVSKAEIT